MNELLKELCIMTGVLYNLFIDEKDPETRTSIIQFHIMVSEKIMSVAKNKIQGSNNGDYKKVIRDIKETKTLADGYKQENTYNKFSGHVIDVLNKVEFLIIKEKIKDEPLPGNQALKQSKIKKRERHDGPIDR